MQLILVLFIVGVLLFPTATHAQPCQDVPPPAGPGQTQYSCSDQKNWGKCGQSWMQGYCLVSCNACPTASPTPPPTIKPVPFQITSKLSVSGTNLQMNGKNVFLNGGNMAWQNYGSDFGFSGPYNYPSQIKTTLQQINQHGGNSMRMWVHCSGLNSPLWDSTGKVTGLPQDFLTSLQQFLRDAKSYNIFVTLVLWNFMITDNHAALYKDDTVLQSYITNALTPMVTALKNEQALAAWEISNEPEGTSVEFGWQTNKVPMASIQKAINWQADAIHKADPTALVTVGSWAADANTDVGGFKNYYTNDQLSKAGGKKQGYLDFYQLHYYAWMKRNNPRSLIDNSFAYYQLDKPLVMGEFSQSSTQTVAPGITIGQIYGHAYDTGYAGAWAWQFAGGQDSDTPDVILQGISSLSSTRALVHDVSLDGDVNGEFDVPTTTTSTSTLSMGLIIGISIAGSVLLIVLVLGAIMCHRRKQHTVTVQHLHEIQDAVQLTQV